MAEMSKEFADAIVAASERLAARRRAENAHTEAVVRERAARRASLAKAKDDAAELLRWIVTAHEAGQPPPAEDWRSARVTLDRIDALTKAEAEARKPMEGS